MGCKMEIPAKLITWRQPDEGNRHLTHAPLKGGGSKVEHSDRSPKREVAVLTQWIKRAVTSQGKEHGFSERNNRSKTSRDDFRLLDFAVDPRCREIGHRRPPEGRLEDQRKVGRRDRDATARTVSVVAIACQRRHLRRKRRPALRAHAACRTSAKRGGWLFEGLGHRD